MDRKRPEAKGETNCLILDQIRQHCDVVAVPLVGAALSETDAGRGIQVTKGFD